MIVDGSNLLFQMFYGMPARIPGIDGRPIQGTLGFVGALLKIVRQVEPSCALVVFDGECANERMALDPDYKANREDLSVLPEEETPFSQLPDIFAALTQLKICFRETENCEADDWIAGYVRAYEGDHRITVVSQDSDFFQLIGPNVTVFRYRGEKSLLCDEKWLMEKLCVRPEQYAAYKSLTGDTSDNIRGVEKIGPKTAAALMQQFGDLESLLSGFAQIAKPSIRTAVENNRDRIRKNHALICLQGAKELPFSLQELAWQYDGSTTMQVLKKIGLR